MVVACEEFLAQHPRQPELAIAFPADQRRGRPGRRRHRGGLPRARGARRAADYCIVGEPTSVTRTGDMIKNGAAALMSGKLTVKGIQGHRLPAPGAQPDPQGGPALNELVATVWDPATSSFRPPDWQVSNIHGGTGASNIIPGSVVVDFNFRFSTESKAEACSARRMLARHGLQPGCRLRAGPGPSAATPS